MSGLQTPSASLLWRSPLEQLSLLLLSSEPLASGGGGAAGGTGAPPVGGIGACERAALFHWEVILAGDTGKLHTV